MLCEAFHGPSRAAVTFMLEPVQQAMFQLARLVGKSAETSPAAVFIF